MDSNIDIDEGPSKSELKRLMTARQNLAEVLSALGTETLKTVPMEDSLRERIAETQKIRTFGAQRRHKQYLGKLMRLLSDEEVQAIEIRLDAIQNGSRSETAKLHHIENLRDELLSDDAALTKLIADFPDLDVQNVRTLIRNARKEKELNKPPKAYREIFQLLKSLEV